MDNKKINDQWFRMKEVLQELRRDGYPPEGQCTILVMALGEVIAADAKDAAHLGEGIALVASAINGGARLAFKRRG
jgi:hypothetical protein